MGAAGAGIHLRQSGGEFAEVTISNCTIAYNQAPGDNSKGGGLSVSGKPTVNIDNTIIWGNQATFGAQIRVADVGVGDTPVVVNFSNVRRWYPEAGDITGPQYIDFQEGNLGTINPDDDPLFVETSSDYSLQGGSPSIDAGSNARVAPDLVDLDSDCGIVPGVLYNVYACDPEAGCICSDPLQVETTRTPEGLVHYGDVVGNPLPDLVYTPPDGFTNVLDIAAYLLTQQNWGTANLPQAHPTWIDLQGPGVGIPPQYILEVSDLTRIIRAWVDV